MEDYTKEMKSVKKERESSKLQWFLFAAIPVIFIVFMILVILSITGVNVFEETKTQLAKIPGLSGLTAEKESGALDEYEERIVNLEADLKDREAQMEKYESIIDSKDMEIQNADLARQRVEGEIEELRAVQNEDKKESKEIVKTFEEMRPNKAAPILVAIGDEEALKILSNVKTETLASILEKMEPETAARLTAELTVEGKK